MKTIVTCSTVVCTAKVGCATRSEWVQHAGDERVADHRAPRLEPGDADFEPLLLRRRGGKA